MLGIDLKIFHERRPNPIKQYIYASLSLRCTALLGLVKIKTVVTNSVSTITVTSKQGAPCKEHYLENKALGISPFRQAEDGKS